MNFACCTPCFCGRFFAVVLFYFFAGAAIAQTPDRVIEIESQQEVLLKTNEKVCLKFKYDVPKVTIQFPNQVDATALSPNEYLVHGLKSGFSVLNVSNSDQQWQTLVIRVVQDVAKIQEALAVEYPNSNLEAQPFGSVVLISGEMSHLDKEPNFVGLRKKLDTPPIINQTCPWSQLGLRCEAVMVSSALLDGFPQDQAIAADSKLRGSEDGSVFSGIISTTLAKRIEQLKNDNPERLLFSKTTNHLQRDELSPPSREKNQVIDDPPASVSFGGFQREASPTAIQAFLSLRLAGKVNNLETSIVWQEGGEIAVGQTLAALVKVPNFEHSNSDPSDDFESKTLAILLTPYNRPHVVKRSTKDEEIRR